MKAPFVLFQKEIVKKRKGKYFSNYYRCKTNLMTVQRNYWIFSITIASSFFQQQDVDLLQSLTILA